MNLLGNRIRELRMENNLTQKQLGEKINVTKVSICCYENGTRMPSLETLIDLSEVFNVKIDYLLGRDSFVIADNDSEYSLKISKEEIIFIKEIRRYDKLYKDIIANPKRMVELIYKKLK